MVTTTEHQTLLAECQQWRDQLRHYREELNQLRNQLYTAAAGKTDKEFLKEVEHYHNQFHIQSINIHDLKHSIKHHISEVQHHPNFGHKIPHHNLEIQLKAMTTSLDQLKQDFLNFINTM
ncbi:hypothetical protein BH10BAC3_BH10BAC3_29010 [soil metagenome]